MNSWNERERERELTGTEKARWDWAELRGKLRGEKREVWWLQGSEETTSFSMDTRTWALRLRGDGVVGNGSGKWLPRNIVVGP